MTGLDVLTVAATVFSFAYLLWALFRAEDL